MTAVSTLYMPERLLGKCIQCEATNTRVAIPGNTLANGTQYYTVDGSVIGSRNPGETHGLRMNVLCDFCKRARVPLKSVRGKITKTKCSNDCWHATGDSWTCRCSCGGMNHGAGYDFIGINKP